MVKRTLEPPVSSNQLLVKGSLLRPTYATLPSKVQHQKRRETYSRIWCFQ